MFENRAMVQTNHRMLAYTAYLTTVTACAIGFLSRAKLLPAVKYGLVFSFLAVNLQVEKP
jgi:heme A synthase